MNNRYLTKERIAETKKTIEMVFPQKTRIVVKRIIEQTGIQLGDVKENIENMRAWMWSQFKKDEPDTFTKILNLRNFNSSAYDDQINDWFNKYIDQKYKLEWETIWALNIWNITTEINRKLKEYNVPPIWIFELLDCQNIDEYLKSKYHISCLDKENLQRTKKIKQNIDDFFCGVKLDTFKMALTNYLFDGDQNKLHNDLQE